MKTIRMGLNTDPDWVTADEVIQRFREGNSADAKQMIEYWERSRVETLELRDKIIEVLEEDGECALSWSCEGRTRHQMHARHWADAMPEYEFEIGGNYQCVVRKRG